MFRALTKSSVQRLQKANLNLKPQFTTMKEYSKLLTTPPPTPPTTTTTTTTTTSTTWNWLRSAAGFYGDESTAIRHSHTIFLSCHKVGSQKHMLQHLLLEDDFFHNHALINLHVWMIHNRLRSLGPQGKIMQEQIFDRFWEDTTTRK